MRVLVVNDYFGFSAGAFAVAWELSGELAERGHEVAFLCATEDKTQAGRQTIDGREVVLLHARTSMRLRPLLTIHHPGLVRRALASTEVFQPDIVHGLLFHLHFSFGLVRGLAMRGWPVILHAQDTGVFCPTKYTCQPPDDPARPASALDCLACQRLRYLPGRASLTRFLVNRHVKAVVAASESLTGILEANGVHNVSAIHAGLDSQKIAGRGWSGERFRAHLGLGGGEPLILFGGRLQKEKGDEAALRALALIDPALGARLVIAGRPELFGPRLRRLAAELDVTDRIVLAGWLDREQMWGAFRAAQVVLVSSLYPDPFPTINLEAMALARPVVGTCFGGTPEAVLDGVTGFIVDPRQPQEAAEKLSRLLADEALAERMGRAGASRLAERFSLSAQADRFEELYQRWA